MTYVLPWLSYNAITGVFQRFSVDDLVRDQRDLRIRRAQRTSAIDDNPDCGGGARARPAAASPQMAPPQAMANILAGQPQRVFLRDGDTCPVCMEGTHGGVGSEGGMESRWGVRRERLERDALTIGT